MKDIQQMLENNEDFINCRRHNNSIAKLMEKYSDSVPDHIIASVLNLSEEELEARYQKIIVCIRGKMGV